MFYGVKSTIKGKNVNDDSDPRNFPIQSEYNTLKIIQQGIGTAEITSIAVDPIVDEIVIPHGLGYIPISFAYFRHPEINRWFKIAGGGSISFGATYSLFGTMGWTDYETMTPDLNNIKLLLYDTYTYPFPNPTENIDYKYFIFADPSTDAWFAPANIDTDDEEILGQGIRVSRGGINVLHAEDRNLIFSTEHSTLKMVRVIGFTEPGSKVHGLPYPPAFFGFMEDPNNAGRYFSTDYQMFAASGESLFSVDNESVYYIGDTPAYIIICLEPLNE